MVEPENTKNMKKPKTSQLPPLKNWTTIYYKEALDIRANPTAQVSVT